jgi:alpha-D-xyloside xylohydrolase
LPAHTAWYDFAENKKYDGGATYQMPVVPERIPVYVRSGSIIPLGPSVQSTTEGTDAQWELRIYGGADGRFTVYEDDGTTYDYEKGAYATYTITWQDNHRTLEIGQRKGRYEGMCKDRALRLVYINGDGQGATKTVMYTGKKITIKL